ncbi:Uncharacterised protein [Bacteroides xylanisolvens]|nr:Uncharacterised protein [Bacteroides xylanisolvens]
MQATETKVKLIPMMIGRPLPKRQIGKSWRREPMPATIIADCTSAADSAGSILTAPATMRIGAILATNMASTCCSPKGTAFLIVIFPLGS